jgi:hypothetical protein
MITSIVTVKTPRTGTGSNTRDLELGCNASRSVVKTTAEAVDSLP